MADRMVDQTAGRTMGGTVWQLTGVAPRIRAAAEAAARISGESVADWLAETITRALDQDKNGGAEDRRGSRRGWP